MLPTVAVLLPTFNRVSVLAHTIDLLRANLHYGGPVRYIIGDDGQGATVLACDDVTVLQGPRRGLGANLNMLIHEACRDSTPPILLQMDDDHHLKRPLNIDAHVRAILDDPWCGWIRLMQVGSHNYTADLRGRYWAVRWDSPELYITSNRPHLKHPRFHHFFGMYPEGLKLGETEEGFCHQAKNIGIHSIDRSDMPFVCVPLDDVSETGWDHVGDSWQQKGY